MTDFEPPPPAPPSAAEVVTNDVVRVEGHKLIDWRIIRTRCPIAPPGEITVCASNPGQYRARRLLDAYTPKSSLPPAKIDVGKNVSFNIRVDPGTLASGYTSNRVTVGMKIKF